MEFPYRLHQIYQLDPLCVPHASDCTLLSTNGAHDLIDYLMVLALSLLLAVLALPTIMHLSAIFRDDGSISRHPQAANARPRFVGPPIGLRSEYISNPEAI